MTPGRIVGLAFVVLFALVILAPFYVQIVYSLKSREMVALTGLAIPQVFYPDNYIEVFGNEKLLGAALRTIAVTVVSVVVLQVFASMCAWVLVRNERIRVFKGLYYLFLAAIMLPFQVVMLPLYSLFREMHLLNTVPGVVLGVVGFQLAYNVFIIASFIKTVPLTLEEAARIDGASPFYTFWRVVFPLLKPIMVTCLVLNTVSSWNDLQISLVIGFKEGARTLQYALYMYFGQYSVEIHQAFAAFLVVTLPVVVLYFVLQKSLMSGLMSGSVKE